MMDHVDYSFWHYLSVVLMFAGVGVVSMVLGFMLGSSHVWDQAEEKGYVAFKDGEREFAEIEYTEFEYFLEREREWSEKTFGPGWRTRSIVAHMRKELEEVEAKPNDPYEWIDLAHMALDGILRLGYSPDDVMSMMVAKQSENEHRTWPDWRTVPEGQPVEYVR